MNFSTRNILAALGGVLLLLIILFLGRPSSPPTPEPVSVAEKAAGETLVNAQGERWGPLPEGSQTYRVMSAENVWPKFVEVTIDPLDVRPGDIQKMRVVLYDDVEVTEVVAEIETDKGINKVPLWRVSQSVVGKADIKGQKYFVKDGRLTLFDGNKDTELALIKSAEAASLQKFVYEGQWLVRDTHSTMYKTKFTAKDAKGRTNGATMAWSDPCTPPASGDWQISAIETCLAGTAVGVENGNITFGPLCDPSTCTLTLNSTLGWNPGQQINLSRGQVFIGAGGQLKQAYICAVDADSDAYYGGQVQFANSSTCADLGASYKRRSTLTGPSDCNDSNANVRPNQAAYFTVATTTNSPTPGTVNFDYNCDGTEIKTPDFIATDCTITGGQSKCAAPPANCIENSVPNTVACGGGYIGRACLPVNCTAPDEGFVCAPGGGTTACR